MKQQLGFEEVSRYRLYMESATITPRKLLFVRFIRIFRETFREEYRLVRNRYRSAIDEAKTEYYSGKVQECAGDQKKLFEIIKSLTKPLQQE